MLLLTLFHYSLNIVTTENPKTIDAAIIAGLSVLGGTQFISFIVIIICIYAIVAVHKRKWNLCKKE